MNKKIKIVIKVSIFTAIPAVTQFLSKSNLLDDLKRKGIIGNWINLNYCKAFLLVISIMMGLILLSINLVLTEMKVDDIIKERDSLIKLHKDMFLQALSAQFNLLDLQINIRIFVEQRGLKVKLEKWIQKLTLGKIEYKKYFIIKNVSSLAEKDSTEKLKFIVEPQKKLQWLVGRCYDEQSICYEENFQSINKSQYNLTKFEESKLSCIKFSLCCPIFNESDKVVAIIEFDSCQSLKIKKVDFSTWSNMVINYSQILYEDVPELFK